MVAGIYDIYIEQGATKTLSVIYKNSTGSPIDLTGSTARMQIRRTVSDPSTMAEFTTETGEIVLGGTAGTISVVMSAAVTASLKYTSGVYDLEIESSAGVVTRVLQGKVAVSKEVTR